MVLDVRALNKRAPSTLPPPAASAIHSENKSSRSVTRPTNVSGFNSFNVPSSSLMTTPPMLRLPTATEMPSGPTAPVGSPSHESTRPTHRRNHAVSASVEVPLESGYPAAETMLFTLLFTAFDERGIGSLDFQEFVVHLAVLARGTVQQQLALCFAAYDHNRDGRITAQDLQRVLDTPVLNDILTHDMTPLSDALVRKHIEDKLMELDILEFALLVDELPRLMLLIDVQHLLEIKLPPPPPVQKPVPVATKPGFYRRRSLVVSPDKDTNSNGVAAPSATTLHPQPPSGSPAAMTSPRASVRK